MVRPLAFLALVLTAACAGTDEEATHAGAICHRIFELCPDGNGWESEDVCEDGYLGDTELGTTCDDEDEYLICANDCLKETSCSEFNLCESTCWDESC